MSQALKLYHIVPPRVEGEYLLPLNELKSAFPQLHGFHAAKYTGREDLINQHIPFLGCPWTDVLQLSPVHPEQIRDALKEIGFGWQSMLCFEIDPNLLKMNETNSVIFKHLPRTAGNFSPRDDEFEPFAEGKMKQYADLPFATRAHFKEAKETSQRPMIFLWVPHVLYRGRIPVADLPIVEIA